VLRIHDTLGADPITFNYCETADDRQEMRDFAFRHKALGMDTESTGINCYKPGWQLRTFQIGNAHTAYVVPAQFKRQIDWIIRLPNTKWIGHNGPHDIRSIDAWLGEDTGVNCAGETYIPAHYADSRKKEDGGIGHGLKEQAIAHVSRDAGKWEQALKAAFKAITVPIPGEVYKSGPRKGTQKLRKIKLSEGWALIDPKHPAYIAYAAADPLLTFRLWRYYQPVVREFYELYRFDKRVQEAGDKLTRRAMRLDIRYTDRLNDAFLVQAEKFKAQAAEYGCSNINSSAQIAAALANYGAVLTARTPTGQLKTDNGVLRAIVDDADVDAPIKEFIHCVLGAKQLLKRRESYTQQMLDECDSAGRVHPSINTLAARTTRMSVSSPPLQQLPTKDREVDAE
jgi:DNA polymerase-1